MGLIKRKTILLGTLVLGFFLLPKSESVVLFKSSAMSAEVKTDCNFIPQNKMRFPVRPSGHISELTFKQIIRSAEAVYDPIFKQSGYGQFKILPLWNDDTVNAVAYTCDPAKLPNGVAVNNCNKVLTTSENYKIKTRVVEMYGGLARHPYMSAEGFLLVICHEIGHHLGGVPRYANSLLSSEGQADYFSTSKCARQILSRVSNNANWVRAAKIPLEVRIACQNSFPKDINQAMICMRSSVGGLSLARVLGSIKSTDWKTITFANADKKQVQQTFLSHPEAQCRLDTYFAGALCGMSQDSQFSGTDYRAGACTPQRFQKTGSRPSCWFKDPLIKI
jgi:hypothetical protein